MDKLIEWIDQGKKIPIDFIKSLEKDLEVIFPLYFKSIIKSHNGGTPKKDTFRYFDEFLQRITESGIGAFIPLIHEEYVSMKSLIFNSPEFFPEGIIAFAETGGGDFICFDYREGKDNSDPPIVYWNHGADIGKDVSFVANNFEEFIELLKESEEEE